MTCSSSRAMSCRVATRRGAAGGAVKEALIRLNPEIEADPRLADEVLYQLRAIILSARDDAEPGRGERGVHGLADRAEVDAVRPERRARHRPADRLRRPETREPVVDLDRGHLQSRAASSSGSTWCCGATASRWSSARPSRRCGRRRPGSTAPPRSTTTTSRTCRSSSCRTCSRSPPRARTSATARSACRSSCGGRGARTTTDDDAPAKVGLAAVKEAVEGVLTPAAVLDFLRFFTAVRDRQEAPQDQDHRPVPAVPGDQPDRRAGAARPDQAGPDLALPGLGQVAADGLRRAEAAGDGRR